MGSGERTYGHAPRARTAALICVRRGFRDVDRCMPPTQTVPSDTRRIETRRSGPRCVGQKEGRSRRASSSWYAAPRVESRKVALRARVQEMCELHGARTEKPGMRRGRACESRGFRCLRSRPAFSSVDVRPACASERRALVFTVAAVGEVGRIGEAHEEVCERDRCRGWKHRHSRGARAKCDGASKS